jgi:crossover junction endodeoxyribonuclease RusA
VSECSVWLPFPPSTNNLFRNGVVKGKHMRFQSKGYRAWRLEAALRLMVAKLPRFIAPVAVKLELTPKDKRSRDADNCAKPVLDALVEARVLPDDSNRFVRSVSIHWQEPAKRAGVVVSICPEG